MLRDLEVHEILVVDATFKAGKELKTGMGVIRNWKTGVADTPAALTSADLVFVQKDRVPTGRNTAFTNFSDYEEEFNTVAENELFVAYVYPANTLFATDQYDTATLTDEIDPTYVAVDTDGKFTTATAASIYQFVGIMNDNGHKLAKIRVCDTAGTN